MTIRREVGSNLERGGSLKDAWADYKALIASGAPGVLAKIIAHRHFEKLVAALVMAALLYLAAGVWLLR